MKVVYHLESIFRKYTDEAETDILG